MNLVHTQMLLLDAATAVVGFAANWLLQSTLLIAAGLAVGWLVRRRGSAVQSAVYRMTLVAVIVCPLATSLLATSGVSGWSIEMPVAWTYEQLSATPTEIANSSPAIEVAPQQRPEPPAVDSTRLEPAAFSAGAAGSEIAFAPGPQREGLSNASADFAVAPRALTGNKSAPVSKIVSNAAPSKQTVFAATWLFQVHAFGLGATGIGLLWLTISAILLLRLGLAWRRLDQLRRGAAPAEAAAKQACAELANLLAVAPPEVLRSPYLASPCLAGLLRPAVLLPEADSSLAVRDVLIHELAHLRRRDCSWNLLRRLGEALFFYQPLLWILSRRLEATAEEVCDDYVVQYGGDRQEYARRLVDIAELASIPASAAGVAMVSLRSILSKRVARILDNSRSLSTRAGNLLLAMVIVGGLAGTTVVGFVGLAPPPVEEKTKDTADDQDNAENNNAENNNAENAALKTEGDPQAPGAAKKPNAQADAKEAAPDDTLAGRVLGDVAYIPVGHAVDTSAGGAVIQQDFRLKHGVWAEGRVFEAETGKPFTGEISYYFFRNRELEEAIPGLRNAYLDALYWTNSNGEFRVPVLPSRGVLAYRYDGRSMDRDGIDRFPRGFGAEEIAGSEELGGGKVFPTQPHYLMPTNYERVAEVPASEGRETVRVEMPLYASPAVTVRAVDEGKPVTQLQVYGANQRFGWQRKDGPEFEIEDLRPGERRKVFIFHRNRNLAGGGFVEHGEEEIVEIKLVEAGSVRGRLVDADGEPIDDATLSVHYEKLQSGDRSAIWAPHPQLSANPTQIPVDKEGRFRLDGLIPGWSYHARASAPRMFQGQMVSLGIGSPFENVQVEPGENKDLGDLALGDENSNAFEEDPNNEEPPMPASKTTTVAGQATDASGQAVAGAQVAVVAMRMQPARGDDLRPIGDVLAEGLTDENGRYELSLSGVSSKTHTYASVIARKEDLAIAWRRINLDATQNEAPLTLRPEEPIRGRLIDLEGQPAAGVRLSVGAVVQRNEGGMPSEGVGHRGEKLPAAWLPSVTSDEQGRFTLRGVPAGYGVFLEAEGSDRFAPQEIAINTGMAEQRGERDATYRSLVKNVKPEEEAVLPLAPAQLFEGVVRYEDTGEPASHARITIWASQQEFGGSMVSVASQADDKGRYRIHPKPGVRFGLTAYPPDGVPYLARQTSHSDAIRWNAGDRIKQVDLTLPRGVLVRGQVVEAGTGKPVAGAAVQYLPESLNNPNDSDDILTGWQGIQLSDGEGRFSIAVLPGPGRLLAHSAPGNYVLQQIGERRLRQGKPGGERYYAHAIAEVNPDVGAESLEVKLELQPGATVAGRIVDEQGKLVEEALVVSRLKISPLSLFWRGHTTPTLGGRFELLGLAKDVEYPVYFLDARRRLGATAKLQATDNEPTIVLQACGQAELRVIDGNGEPVPGYYANVQMVVTPGANRYDIAAARSGELGADADFISNIDRTNYPDLMKSDEHGNLTLPALIPGASYQIAVERDGRLQIVKEFQAKANETLDLGDLVVEREQ